jgi:hypothetical protein
MTNGYNTYYLGNGNGKRTCISITERKEIFIAERNVMRIKRKGK